MVLVMLPMRASTRATTNQWLLCVILLNLLIPIVHSNCDYSGATKVPLTTGLDWIQKSIDRHNEYRAKHGVCPLVHNQALSEVAQWWANDLASRKAFEHSQAKCLGENLASSGTNGVMTSVNSSFGVDGWYEEIKDYDFNTGKVKASSTDPGIMIEHLPQVLWKDSLEVGTAFASYKDNGWTHFVVVAEYYPPGNYIGEETKQVFPKRTPVPNDCQKLPQPRAPAVPVSAPVVPIPVAPMNGTSPLYLNLTTPGTIIGRARNTSSPLSQLASVNSSLRQLASLPTALLVNCPLL